MADERPPIRPDDASDILRAAQQEQIRAAKLLTKTEAAAGRVEQAVSRYTAVRQGSGSRPYAIHDESGPVSGTGRYASEEAALKRIAQLNREARIEAERRAAVVPAAQQYAKPIGPELPTQRATGDRAIRERRDLLREEGKAARSAAADSLVAERQALGRARAQRTRLRKLEEAPTWTYTGQDPAERERQIANARAAVGRAEASAGTVSAAREASVANAQRATDAERAFEQQIRATNRAFGLRQQLAERGDVTPAAFGSDAEAERVLQARAREAAASAERARLAANAGVKVDSPEVLRRAEQERVRLAAAATVAAEPRPQYPFHQSLPEYRRPDRITPTGAPAGRATVARLDELEAQADRRLERERQRREDSAAVRATVSAENKAKADAEAAEAAKLQAAAERQAAVAAEAKAQADLQSARAAPGTAIVPRTVANAGLRSRAELEAIEGLYGLQRGPVFGEYPSTRYNARQAIGYGQQTFQGVPLGGGEQRRIPSSSYDAGGSGRTAAQAFPGLGQQNFVKRAADLEALAKSEERVAASAARMRAQYQQFGTTLGTVSQAQRKHGALTTEFINAAVRGEASYKEWGYQIGATAAKFAGWTAVSIPVFAAIEGVRRIGQGAIASSSGVGQLQRVLANVDGGAAQEVFRDLSGKFNVPIQATTDAVFRMAQVFHSLPEATQAANAALYSFKVGGIDVETGTKNLLAIATGFGASGGELLGFFDQINQAQNQFGITIQNTEAGVAKAAGTFRNAGGDFSYLLALIATGQRATGRTGENIGTAVQRSVGFIQRPTNQQQLREFGIDPTKGIESVYDQAFQRARTLQGEQLQKLATALSSPQYASYFVPILQNERLFRQLQSGTSPEASRGSAQAELEKVLGQLDEQISKIGNNFERLGSNIGTSGFLAPLIQSVGAMNLLVGTTNVLLGLFNGLPGPLREALAVLVLLKGAATVGRRVGVGEALDRTAFSGAAPYLIERPEARARRAIEKGSNDALKAARDEQQRAVQRAFADTSAARTSHEVRDRQVVAIDKAAQQGLITEEAAIEARTQANLRIVAAEARAAESAVAATAALRFSAEQEILRADLQAAQVGLRGRARDDAVKRFANERGLYVNPSLRTDAPRSELAARAENIAFDPDSGRIVGATDDAQRPARRLTTDARAGLRRLRTGLQRDAQQIGALGRAYGPVAAASGAIGISTQRVETAARATGRGLVGAAAGIRAAGASMLAMIGPWGIAFAALLAAPEIYSHVKGAIDRYNRDANPIAPATRPTSAGQRAAREKLVEDANRGETLGGIASDIIDIRHPFRPLGYHDQQRRQAALDKLAADDRTRRAQSDAAAAGLPRISLPVDRIQKSIDKDFAEYEAGIKVLREAGLPPTAALEELRANVELRQRELLASAGGGARAAARRQRVADRLAARLGRTGTQRDFYRQLFQDSGIDSISHDVLDSQIAGLEQLVGTGEATSRQTDQLQASYAIVIAQTKGKTDKKSLTRFAQATQGFRQTVSQAADAELQRNLAFARTQQERDDAYQQYEDAISPRGVSGGVRRELRRQRVNARFGLGASRFRERYYEHQRGLAAADIIQGQGTPEDFKTLYTTTQAIGQENIAQAGYRATIARTKGNAKRIIDALKLSDGEQKFMMLQIRRARLEQAQALAAARTTVVANTLPAGATRIRYQIAQAGKLVAQQIKEFGRGSVEALTAIAQQQQLQQELVDEQYADIQSRANYAAALATTPGGEAAANIQGLRNLIAFAVAHPRRYKPSEVRDLRAQLVQAQQDEAKRLQEEAEDLIASQYDVRRSRTDNPVRIARLNAQEARRRLRRGGFENQAERNRAIANRNSTRRDYENAIADRRLENAEYAHDIGKLSDEQYLNRLRAIQKTYEKGSEGYRRLKFQIGRFKHDLNNATELELTPGSIRLPTIGEIKRFIGSSKAAAAASVSSTSVATNNANTFNISVAEGEAGKVWDVLETAGISVTSAARNKRVG